MANLFDVLLGWILLLHPAIGILLVSLLISVITTFAIKIFSDQSLMKDLKQELKDLQKKMRELKNNPKKMAKINEKVMETNAKYMSHSMRPTLFTIIPILLIFGWLNSHIGYYPLWPGQPFELTAEFEEDAYGNVSLVLPEGIELSEGTAEKEILRKEVSWLLTGEEGEYSIGVRLTNATYEKQVLVTTERKYAPVEKNYRNRFLFFSSANEDKLNEVRLSNKEVKPFEDVPVLKTIPLLKNFNWFWTYFLFSIIFSMSFRRIFNIY